MGDRFENADKYTLDSFFGTYEDLVEDTKATPDMYSLDMSDFHVDEVKDLMRYMTPEELKTFDALIRNSPPRALMPHQMVPHEELFWEVYLLVGGRGVGKTVAGASEVRAHLRKYGPRARVGIGAPTIADARDTCMEGEALALDTLIPTPKGWTIMGKIKKGDLIYDQNGEVQKVNLVSDVKYDRPCYRVTFDDGSSIVTDEKHKWLTYNKLERDARYRSKTKYAPQIRTTKEILETLKVPIESRNESNHAVPTCGPIDCDSKVFTIHPYVLGAWLGDGTSKSGAITTEDQEIISNIKSCGYQTTVHSSDSSGWATTFGILGLQKQLRLAGLLKNKHIPEDYFRGSLDQRLDLIKGLMDTDGYVSNRGQCAFDNTNLEIVEGLKDLLESCGVKVGPIQSKKDKRKDTFKIMYRITFTPHLEVFKLTRKLDRQIFPDKTTGYRYVRSIEKVESVPVQCIAVSGPSHLYLAGNYIPTHNTGLITMFPNEFVDKDGNSTYKRSMGEARHIDGGWVKAMGTEKPKRWNGPQWSMIWFDELSLCNQDAWNDANLGLRMGERPYAVCTCTPKNKKWIKALALDKTTYVPQYYDEATGKLRLPTTFDNKFLPARRVEWLKNKFAGTRLGKQELEGAFTEDIDGAMWNRKIIHHRLDVDLWPTFVRIIVAIDPAGSSARKRSDENAMTEEQRNNQRKNADTAIAVVALGTDRRFYVLEVKSAQWRPEQWAVEAIKLYHVYKADKIVAEKNFGGDMVESTLRNVDQEVTYTDDDGNKRVFHADGKKCPIKLVTASRGKDVRAQPVVALYEQHKVYHTKNFGPAEDQMCAFIDADDNEGADMVDAVVWAFTEIAGLDMGGSDYIILPGDPRFKAIVVPGMGRSNRRSFNA